MIRLRILVPLALLLAAITVAAGCAPARSTGTPTATPSPPMNGGKALYEQKCAACHGLNAAGTSAAPAIAGHSESGTKMQVRTPMDKMPAFPLAALSDHDLGEIAEYLVALGPAPTPIKDWEKAAPETVHLWMALLAMKGNDPTDASHHLRDVMTFVKDPMHKAEAQEALDLIAQGKPHEAEHEIEEMAGSEAPSGVTRQRLHLVLAMRSIEAMNAAEAKHHLEHFLVRATEKEKPAVNEALEHVHKGEFHDAEHEIEELLKG